MSEPAYQNAPTRMTGPSLAELAGQLLVLAAVTLTPWWFGGVESRVQVWLFVGVSVALACSLVGQLAGRAASRRWPVAVVPLVAALGLGVFQLVPWGTGTLGWLSPAGAELRGGLLPTPTSPDAALEGQLGIAPAAFGQTVSLYPASTRRDLAMLVLAVAVFVLGASLFRSPRAQLWLCGLVALSGAAIAFFGLVQKLAWNGLLFWSVPLAMGGSPFGPFVNRNNAGGFLILGLAGAVALTVWAAGRNRPDHPDETVAQFQQKQKRSSPARVWDQFAELAARLDTLTVAAMVLAASIVGGILCTLSRGAGLAMIGATAVTILVVLGARGRRLRLWPIVLAAAGLGLVGWVGMSGAVQARFATLWDQKTVTQNRIPHWRDGLEAAADFWPAGSGLGTYRYVYRPYEASLSGSWYYHAENQYLEALVEGGVVGLGLVLAMIGLVGAAAWRLVRDGSDRRMKAFGIAVVFALSGQAISGFFDFGLYLPANFLVFALLCGAASGGAAAVAREGARQRGRSDFLTLPPVRLLGPALVSLILAASVWGCLETRSVAAVETTLRTARFAEPPHEVSPEAVTAAIRQVEAALGHRPDDAEAQHRLAALWLLLYRARAYRQLREEVASAGDDPRLWQATSQIVLHGRAQGFAQSGLVSQLDRLRAEPVVEENLRPALAHLVLARRACPLLAEVHATIGELSVLAADPSGNPIHLERARRLAPSDPDMLFRCGVLDFQAGRIDSAAASWKRCLALSRRHLGDVLLVIGRKLGSWQIIEQVLPDSPVLLLDLANGPYQGEQYAEIRRMLADRAEHLIHQADLPEEERYYLRASALALQDRYPEAIDEYFRAVQRRPQEAGWRYQLARLLSAEGRITEAHEQAKLCARLEPADRKYRTLLQEINRTRLTAGKTPE